MTHFAQTLLLAMLFVNVAASQGILAPSILKQASATDGQCLAWSSSNSQWEPADCSDSSINIEENNVEVIAAENLTGIDFLGADFDVTDDANEANIAIAAAITRDAEVGALAAAAASVTAGAGAVPKGDVSPGRLDISWLASGTPDGSQFVRDDRTLAQVAFSQLTGTASDAQVPDTITLTSIGQAGDVDMTGIADGECLVYDGVTDNRLEPGACGGGGASALNDLTDVDTSGAEDGNLLLKSGSEWVRSANAKLVGTQWEIGDGTNGSVKIGSAVCTAVAGVLTCTDASDYALVLKTGSTQTSNLTEWRSGAGGLLASVNKEGHFDTSRLLISGGIFGRWSADLLTVRSAFQFLISSGSGTGSGFDVGFRRSGIGVLQCTDGVVGGGVGHCTAFDAGGYRVNGSAPSGHVIRCNGTDCVAAQLNYSDMAGTVPEANDLETDGAEGIADTEIYIGTGAGTGNYAAISGDATLANTGALTVVDDSHAHTGATVSDLKATMPGVEIFAADTAVTTGDGKRYIPIPADLNGYVLTGISASVITVGTSSVAEILEIQIARCAVAATGNQCASAVDMLTTLLSIDSGEANSSTAASAVSINTSNDAVATGQVLRVDVDDVHAGTAPNGLFLTFEFEPAP